MAHVRELIKQFGALDAAVGISMATSPMGFLPVPSRLLKADQLAIYQERLRLSCTLNNMAMINHNYGL